MKRFCYQCLFLFVVMSLLSCRLTSAPTGSSTASTPPPIGSVAARATSPRDAENISALPVLSDLADGWNQIDPGGDTACARGGKYSFFVRKANSNKLLIYFEGGGSCYDAQTCRVGGDYFDDSIDPKFQADNPALKTSGVFALTDGRNPFRDYNIVFVGYCTGDAYLGNKKVSYEYEGHPFQVDHFGYENARVVLNWTYQNFPKPDSIFTIGCSAGVAGSFFHSPHILENYKDVPFTLIGDSGGGYMDGPASYAESAGTLELLPNWLPQYKDLVSDGVIHSKLFFTLPAQAYPGAHFGFVDTLEDSVQSEIVSRIGSKLTLAQIIQNNLANIRVDVPDFYSYSGPGNYHCITMDSVYYDYQVNGTRLNDWLTALASGRSVVNITP